MKKILLIEDEEIMIDLLQRKIAQEGYEIRVARNGEEGLAAMKEKKPDLVLLDIIMPKMEGFEVMEHMQADKDLKKIPVIVISNSGQPVEIDRAQKLGAKDWLIKTEFDPQEVIEKVKKQLPTPEAEELLQITINLLKNNPISYPDFFIQLRKQFCQQWQDQPQNILKDVEPMEHLDAWRQQYYHHLQTLSYPELEQIKQRLNHYNPQVVITRPEIEAVWEQITLEDNWQPFNNLLTQIQTG